MSGVLQGGVLGLLLFLLYTSSDLFSILVLRVTVEESLSHDLIKVSEWCDLWGKKLNASKTKTVMVSRSHTMHHQSPALTIDGTVLKESDDLVILRVTFYSKITFEKHLRSDPASQRLSVLRKSWQVFHDRLLLGRCFQGFVLPDLEYSLQYGAWLSIHTLNYWNVQSVVPVS